MPARPISRIDRKLGNIKIINTAAVFQLASVSIKAADRITLLAGILRHLLHLAEGCPPRIYRLRREISKLESRRYEALVVCVRLIIWLTYSQLTFGPVSKRLLCVRLPPDLCIETDAMSAPAAIAFSTGIFFPK